MRSIEEDEEFMFHLEQIENKFCAIKNVLREIKSKIKHSSGKNKIIVDNLKHWVAFFTETKENEQKVIENDENSYFENIDFDSALHDYDDEYIKKTNETVKNNSNLTEDSFSFAVFDVADIPESLSGDKLLLEIFEFIKKQKTTTMEQIKQNFAQEPERKIEIFVKFLAGRYYIHKKHDKIIYKL